MARIAEVASFLEGFAPIYLAEDWDNIGLLVGDAGRDLSAVMTCLTLTPDVAMEAIDKGVQLVVSHHPLLFRPVQKITADDADGRMLIELIEAGIAVYSPHTGYDSAVRGINQQLAEALDLEQIDVLRPSNNLPDANTQKESTAGAGRYGTLPTPMTLNDLITIVKKRLGIQNLQYVGELSSQIERVGIACGSAAEFMHDALARQCEVLLTGEARFHACLEARTSEIALVLVGHYASERPAVERLAEILAAEFPDLSVWASQQENNPIRWA